MIEVKFECDATITINRANNLVILAQHQRLLDDIAGLPKPISIHIFSSQGKAIVEPCNTSPKNLAKEIAKNWESQGFKVKVIND